LTRIGDVHQDVLVIPGYTPWNQISNLLTLALTQHGNTLKIENIGSKHLMETTTLHLGGWGMFVMMMML